MNRNDGKVDVLLNFCVMERSLPVMTFGFDREAIPKYFRLAGTGT